MAVVCDREDKNKIFEGRYGPGRTLGKVLDVAGHSIDRSLRRSRTTTEHTSSLPDDSLPSGPAVTNPLTSRLASISCDVSCVCDAEDSDDPVDGLYGPGRTVGKALGLAGHQLDEFISKKAEQIGYGPRITAEGMRRRLRLVEHSFIHYKGRDSCKCYRCRWPEEFMGSPTSIKMETENVRKDALRLLKYTRSNVLVTRKQAVDGLCDLSLEHHTVRALFKQMGAVSTVEKIIQTFATVRHGDGYLDNLLLSSSPKALVSFREAEIITLLQKWRELLYDLMSHHSDLHKNSVSLWCKVAPFLHDPEFAFVVMRSLGYTASEWKRSGRLVEEMIGWFASSTYSVNHFELQEFENVSGFFLNNICSIANINNKSIVADYICRFAGSTSRILEPRLFQLLSMKFEAMGSYEFINVHILKAVLMQAEKRGDLSVHPKIMDYFSTAISPVEREVCEVVWKGSNDPSDIYTIRSGVYTTISQYIDSNEPELREKAWEYANHFLARDQSSCDLMLEAISKATFASTIDLCHFKRTKRMQHAPNKGKPRTWERIYRHFHIVDGTICFEEGSQACPKAVTKTEQLEYVHQWMSNIYVEGGTSVSMVDRYPLLAGYDSNGKQYYVAYLLLQSRCSDCDQSRYNICFPMTEGTKPEDLRIEVHCPHRKVLEVPKWFRVLALRYPPEGCPEAFGDSDGGVDATGPFSWLPTKRRESRRRPYTVRVISILEVMTRMIVSDNDNIAMCQPFWIIDKPNANSSMCAGIARYIDSSDLKLRAKAWDYANCVLAWTLESCDLMLEALSKTAFATAVDFTAFKVTRKAKHVPAKDDPTAWTRIYRYVQKKDGRACLGDFCDHEILEAEQLDYARGWVSYVCVRPGVSISAVSRYQLIAGSGKGATYGYVGRLRLQGFRGFRCVGCCEELLWIHLMMTSETNLEDLCVEICCPHQKEIFYPDRFEVVVLRYPPDEYPKALSSGNEEADATGPFSWKPAESFELRRKPYTVRITNEKEAEANGVISDDRRQDSGNK